MPFTWLDIEFVIKDQLGQDSHEVTEILTQFPLTSIIPEDASIEHFRQICYQSFEDHIKLQLLKMSRIIARTKFRWIDSLRDNIVEFDDQHGFHLMLKRFEADDTHLRSRKINVAVKTLRFYTINGQGVGDTFMPEAGAV